MNSFESQRPEALLMTPHAISTLFFLAFVPAAFAQEGSITRPSHNGEAKTPTSPQEQYQALLDEMQHARAELTKSAKGQGSAQRQLLNERTEELYRKFAPRFLDLAEKYPKQPF